MSRTIDSIMAAHDAARQRREQEGRPIWDRRLYLGDVFHNDDLTFEERRDEIVRRIQGSRWYAEHGDDSSFAYVVEELGDATDPDEFDDPWDEIYDQADADRVWIETLPSR